MAKTFEVPEGEGGWGFGESRGLGPGRGDWVIGEARD